MGLYIQIHSMHGLIRSKRPEIGKDSDTGGQVVYVLELAKALGRLRNVEKVDILTRKIDDPNYTGYTRTTDPVSEKVSIIRIPCGPSGYIKKVDLWPHIDEFVRNTEKYIKKIRRVPDILHSNYADSGLVCSKLSEKLGIPFVHTGHSMGRPKMKSVGANKSNFSSMNEIFHFDKRLSAEQKIIDSAWIIIASTKEEFKNQYSGYRIGKNEAKFRFIPPGIDLSTFHPDKKQSRSQSARLNQFFWNIVDRNLKNPEKPIIAALSRMTKAKNLQGLVLAFAQDRRLQSMANLVIFSQILDVGSYGQRLIRQINSIIRKNDLYGKIVMPAVTLDYEKQVPAYYRFVAEHRGVFVNPAFLEPFGLTVLEAGACGLPVVATKNGGPSEIIENGKTGLLIDPYNPADISRKIKKILLNRGLWNEISKNAVRKVRRKYSWDVCARHYMQVFGEALGGKNKLRK